MIKPVLFSLLLAAAAGPSQGQTVWRCGPDGRSYTDAPCPGGLQVVVDDPRSPIDLAEARAVATRERRLAQQLVVDRREREHEALARGSGLAAIRPTDQIKPQAREPAAQAHLKPKRRPHAAASTSRSAAHETRRRRD